ncbi:MAG: riboflavin synthase [Lentisphaeria bacterium]|nr:riboflavin synthase [Lentisphaeria bacterium]
MFTGLVETIGTFLSADLIGKAGKLRVEAGKTFSGLTSGESIAVNGACLTLEKWNGALLEFHVLEETFRKTNLGKLQRGSRVNLERALALGDRLGGHIVSGHVDGTGKILSLARDGEDMVLTVSCTPEMRQFMVPEGSIAVNGISLTLADLQEDRFSIHIIPTTWNETNLPDCRPGDLVNLECDMLGKYVQAMLRRMAPDAAGDKINWDTLKNAGFGFH